MKEKLAMENPIFANMIEALSLHGVNSYKADPVDYLAAADLLEELGGKPHNIHVLRWMGRTGLRPGYRQGGRVQKPWCWYLRDAWQFQNVCAAYELEYRRYWKAEYAQLPIEIFKNLPSANPANPMRIYESWTKAVFDLAATLDGFKKIYDGNLDGL